MCQGVEVNSSHLARICRFPMGASLPRLATMSGLHVDGGLGMLAEIVEQHGSLTALRRELHQYPELSYEETRTAGVVAQFLSACGLLVHTGIGGTGVVGQLRKGSSSRSIGITAELDALPIQEANRFGHRSRIAGRMHACGHDGHTVILLGAAQYLARHGVFDGTVNFIFRPAEESGAGARAMLRDGLFERFPCQEIYGLHNVPDLPQGHVGSRVGAITSATARFRLRVCGRAGHAARPHLAVDPVFVGAQIVSAMQALVSRMADPGESVALSVTRFSAGDSDGGSIIPEEAILHGSVRCGSNPSFHKAVKDLGHLVSHVAMAFGARAELQMEEGYPACVCAPEQTDALLEAATRLLGPDRVVRGIAPTLAGDDYSYLLDACPGSFLFIGNGTGAHRGTQEGMGPCVVHNPWFDFNDELLPIGASVWSTLVQQRLAPTTAPP